jgi:hypothetical protein
MTEMAQGMSQSPDNSSVTPASSSQQSAPAQTSAPTHEERTFRQSEVTDIVRRERQEAVDRYQRIQRDQPEYAAQKYGDVARQPQQQPASQTGYDETRYRQIASEEAQRLRDEWTQEVQARTQEEHAQRTVQNFWGKVNAGREKYTDFDQVTGDIELVAFPNVVQLLADYVDNSGDVLYSLGQDLSKMELLEGLANRSPKSAIKQIQRLADSLKQNETAKSARTPNEPLSQLRPSNNGLDNNGAMSVSDYRKKYRG